MTAPVPLHFTSLADRHMVGDVVDVFVAAARKLGYEVSTEHAAVRHDAINVVCFAHHLAPEVLQGMDTNCIVLNFEQLVAGSQAFNESYLTLLRNHYVWDYSRHNLARYAELGIPNGHHVPLGYEEDAGDNVSVEDLLPEALQDRVPLQALCGSVPSIALAHMPLPMPLRIAAQTLQVPSFPQSSSQQ